MSTIPIIPSPGKNTIKAKMRAFTLALLGALTLCGGAKQAFAIDVDLAVTAFSALFPGTITPGGHPTSFTYTVQNLGPGSVGSGFTPGPILIDLYLSLNTVFGDGDDLPLGQVQFSFSLPFGSVSTITSTSPNGFAGFTVPGGANGTYRVFLRITIPASSGRTDPNLSNNVGLLPGTITVSPTVVNHAPAGTDKTVTMFENAIYTFAQGDFGFSDLNDSPGNTLLAVKVTTLPGAGSLANNGVAVSAGTFISQADIAAGNLKFTPAAEANGTSYASFTFQVQDNGGIAGGGADLDPTANAMTVTITAVNSRPSFTKGANQAVVEDAAAQSVAGWATLLSAGPADESGQVLNFIVSNDNNALFAIQPSIVANGTLTYTPAANANGSATVTVQIHDNGGTANGGMDTSAAQTFTVTVTAVNDRPSFTGGSSQTVPEDAGVQTVAAWATAISAGPANESTQVLNFIVSNNNNALFATQPNVAANGTLSYTPAANANGSATVTVQIHDDGGIANGGVDTSVAQTFTITLTAVNDAPSFTKGADQTVLEDAAVQSVAGWATARSAGPANESTQVLNFIGSNNNNALFATQPSIAANGTLTYSPAANANGSATVTVQIHDDGGTANGGVDTGATQTFTITVTPVNDVPSFTKGANQTVLEDAGAQAVTGWAAAISAGPADESGQVLNFIVSNNNNPLFATQPGIAANGTLSYTPAANANGSATVTVQIHDDGGTANGGVDTSTAQTFTITITAVNDVASFTKGANQTVSQLAGAQSMAGWATGLSAGPANESGQVLSFIVSNNNNVLFTTQPSIAANGTLSYTPATNAKGIATVTVQIHDDGGTANGGVDTSVTQTFTITVLTAHEAWRQQYFGSPDNSGPGADGNDFEGDGVTNLLEWAFGLNPLVNDGGAIVVTNGVITQRGIPTLLVTNILNGVDFRVLFGRRKNDVASGLTYKVQFSADLGMWEDATAAPQPFSPPAEDGEIEAVTVTYPLFLSTGRKAQFFRVFVTGT